MSLRFAVVVRLSALVVSCASVGACATITRGTTTEFVVESTPPGAAVRTSSGFTCPATPCTFKMPRKDAFDVTVSLAGYRPQAAHVRSQVAGAGGAGMAGNILIGGIIGVGVDAASGAMNDLNPNPLRVDLKPKDAAPANPPTGGGSPTTKETIQ